MVSPKRWALIPPVSIVLISLGLLCLYAKQIEEEKETWIPAEIEVVKAARYIPAGTPLTMDKLTTELVTHRFLPPNPLFEQDLNIYLGQPLQKEIMEGSMILTSDFSVQERVINAQD